MNNRYLKEVVLYLGILMLVFFSFYMPAWQFLSYDIHCDRLEDKCIVKESISHVTVKTIKISETNKLTYKTLYIPKRHGGSTEVKYLSLEKKDGSYSFVRGLLADTKDKTSIDKFNDFICGNSGTILDYTNKNIDFKVDARIFVVLCLVIALCIPFFEREREQIYTSEDKTSIFPFWNILIVALYILLFTAAFTTGEEAQKIKTEERDAAREATNKTMYLNSCSRIEELTPTGKMSIWLEDNNGEIFADFVVKDMTNEKLKELYKIDQHNYLKEGIRGILEEGENTLTVRTQYNQPYVLPACIHKWTFYGKNECLNAGECYVEVVPYSEYYPNVAGAVKKYQFIKRPGDLNDKYVITLRVSTMD